VTNRKEELWEHRLFISKSWAAKGANSRRFTVSSLDGRLTATTQKKYGIVEIGGGPVGINGSVGPANDGGKRVSIYARVEDLQATLDRAECLAGKTILPPTEVPGGPKLAMFADPAGNITGLFLGKQAG